MLRRLLATAVIATAAAALLIAAKNRSVRSVSLSGTRSFVVTDKSIVEAFTLDRVLAQLVARSGAGGITPQQLLRQMYDTQNPRPGLAEADGPHCDDFLMNGKPSFNGFPRRCPTPEARLAATPYLADEYFTLGLINRFDLAPADGSNCGQYRLVFAHREKDLITRLHLIFEAVLPNPNPSAGLAACRPVAQFWASLSSVDSMDERRARLETFFFDGLKGFAPVIDPAHFDGTAQSGIRTLQQVAPPVANRFYQFRLKKDCASGECTLRFVPDVLENQAFGPLFDARVDTPQGRAFRDHFVTQVQTLAARDINGFFMRIPNQYLMVESHPVNGEFAFDYENPFKQAAQTPAGAAFRNRIQAELDRIGSRLTPEQIVLRSVQQTCFGCHGFNGLNLGEGVKLELGFFSNQMISEDTMADGEAGPLTRYGVDPIVEKQFVPNRIRILENFLRSGTPPPAHSN